MKENCDISIKHATVLFLRFTFLIVISLYVVIPFCWGNFDLYFSGDTSDKIHFTLKQAIDHALMANRTIANAIDNITQATYLQVVAKSEFELKIFPEVYLDFSKKKPNYGAGVSLSKKLPIGTNVTVSPTLQKTGDYYNSGLNITMTQPLLKGRNPFYNLYSVRQSDYYLRMSQRELYLTQINIVMSTISTVYEVIRRREILRLHQSSFDRSQGYAEATQLKQKMKFATTIDVYRANIKLKQAESLLINSLETYQDSLENLKFLLAVPLEQQIEVSATLKFNRVNFDENKVIETSLRKRVELQQFQDMIDNLELQSEIAKQNILPDLKLVLRYTAQGNENELNQSLKRVKGDFKIGLESSGNTRKTNEKAEYQSSLLTIKSAKQIYEVKKEEIKRAVKFALRNLIHAGKSINIQQEQIEQAKGKLELARLKFMRGMAGNFDLVEAETEVRESEINLISAVITYIVGQYRLKATIGTLINKQGKVYY